MKRQTAAIILAAATAVCASCSSGNTGVETKDNTSGESSQQIAADKFDGVYFEDGEFNILYIGNTSARNLIRADELNGDSMNDAIFERASLVKEKLGVTINYIEGETDSTSYCANAIKRSVQAGDDAYQMGVIHRVDGIADLVASGYLYNYEELPYIDLDADYWERGAMDIMSYKDNCYFGYNDLYPISTFCFFFNKDIADEIGESDIYDYVYDGTWTIDKMEEMIRLGSSDLNGDGVYTREDRYGLAIRNPTILSGLYFGCGINLSENKGDHAELSLYSEKMISLFEKTYALLSDNSVCYVKTADDLTIRSGQIFLYMDSLDNANGHRTSDIDFGLLPYPKYDEDQEKYISFANPNLQCVPASIQNPELVGAVIEFMASNAGGIREAFYEKTLKGKVATDEDSSAMVDIMMDNYVVDFAANYCGFAEACTRLYNVYSYSLTQGSGNFVSFYETYAAKAQAEIDSAFKNLTE